MCWSRAPLFVVCLMTGLACSEPPKAKKSEPPPSGGLCGFYVYGRNAGGPIKTLKVIGGGDGAVGDQGGLAVDHLEGLDGAAR